MYIMSFNFISIIIYYSGLFSYLGGSVFISIVIVVILCFIASASHLRWACLRQKYYGFLGLAFSFRIRISFRFLAVGSDLVIFSCRISFSIGVALRFRTSFSEHLKVQVTSNKFHSIVGL